MSKVPKWDRSKGRPEPIAALNRVKELENNEPLVKVDEACPSVILHRETVIPYVREGVAERMEAAAKSLPDGIHLGLMDAWRPFIRQVKIYEWFEGCTKEAFPHLSYPALRRKVCRFVAPVDQKAPPGHCTGAAVDVVLVSKDNEPFDMVSPYTRLEAAPTYTYGLSDTARYNRNLLADTMLEAGFSNCRDEYWHYSFGDAGWAVRLALDECIYGLVELDETIWKAKQRVWEKAMSERPNPYLEAPSSA
jgi:D-alanyl-D-alanine dipeptidase